MNERKSIPREKARENEKENSSKNIRLKRIIIIINSGKRWSHIISNTFLNLAYTYQSYPKIHVRFAEM